MSKADKLVEVCERLPGFYGYRPSMNGNDIQIDEIFFRLEDQENECEYLLTIFLQQHKCVGALIDARYSDKSVARILDEDEDFSDVIAYKNKLITGLNQFL